MAEARIDQRWRENPRNRGLRASDDDRETVAALLRAEHMVGRIDAVELEERMGRCLASRTYADLDQLVADLPRPEPSWTRRRRSGVPPQLAFLFIPLVIAAIVLSHGHALWLIFPLAFFVGSRPALSARRRYVGTRRW